MRSERSCGLHLAVLLGLEVALLGGDVLHQLPRLVAAHLASKFLVGMAGKGATLSAIGQRIAFREKWKYRDVLPIDTAGWGDREVMSVCQQSLKWN